MESNGTDLVRGKKRQRRKTRKSKSGCVTCRIRRIKCDEERPACRKCVSTGRRCDGYVEEDNKSASHAGPAGTIAPDAGRVTFLLTAISSDADLPWSSNEPTSAHLAGLLTLSFPLGFPSNCHPSPAFDYFLHRSSLDLTGSLHAEVWNSYVLSICATSPAIRHAIAAHSGFHKLFAFPESEHPDDREYWKQYFLASEAIRVLVGKMVLDQGRDTARKEEVLVSCIIFGNIELLLGNMNAAVQHLESGLAIMQQFLSPTTTRKTIQSYLETEPQTLLDNRVTDLVHYFARLDLQILTFLPSQRVPTSQPVSAPAYAIVKSTKRLSNAPASELDRMLKHSLFWIRHFGSHRCLKIQPPSLRSARDNLLGALERWYWALEAYQEEPTPSKPELISLLTAYHLTALQLRCSLSPYDTIFDEATNLASFRAIIKYCRANLAIRSSRLDIALSLDLFNPVNVTGQDDDDGPVEMYSTLEDCTADALYYTALKCRHPRLRREARVLLSGIESGRVWDGPMMAKVAEFVTDLEEYGMFQRQEETDPLLRYYGTALGGVNSAFRGDKRRDIWPKEENRAKSVEVDVDRENGSVYVRCHLLSEAGLWSIESTRLDCESMASSCEVYAQDRNQLS